MTFILLPERTLGFSEVPLPEHFKRLVFLVCSV